MSWWEERVLPHLVDRTLDTGPVRALRAQTCAGLGGRVLELGFGSGTNIPFYPAEVEVVAAVEPSDTAWRLSQERRETGGVLFERVGLDAQRVDQPDHSADSALTTFTLCTVPDHEAALREVRRILKPGGVLHFLEHGSAPAPRVRTWQRRLEPVQRRVAGGCHLTRDPLEALARAGFIVEEHAADYLPGPRASRPFAFVYRGRARVAAGA